MVMSPRPVNSDARLSKVNMIDRGARNELAVLVRRLIACRITNFEFDESVPGSDDPAVQAVRAMAWSLYDDLEVHRLDGRRRLSKPDRRVVARWILFLYSDEEYSWPDYDLFRIYNWPMNLLTFGWWERKKADEWSRFKAAGDFEVWPFMIRSPFEAALSNPTLLAGHDRAQQLIGMDAQLANLSC